MELPVIPLQKRGLRQNGDIFGTESLHERCPGGASGHETDKTSASSPAGTVLLAKGLNPDDGGAEMVYYATTSSGAVFSVGSITWPLALLVDSHVSRITSHVIRRFPGETEQRIAPCGAIGHR
ncbi:MAG: hypothetical protein NZ699_15885 [Roseiflexus sp.]|nr:hypothetical protein [Roseiflexus sp.]